MGNLTRKHGSKDHEQEGDSMKDETGGDKEKKDSSITVRKEFVPFEQSSAIEEPLFVNHFQVAQHGTDAYIDAGVIPLDDILSPEKSGELRFIVLERLVMSIQNLRALRDQISSLLEKTEGKHVKEASTQSQTGSARKQELSSEGEAKK